MIEPTAATGTTAPAASSASAALGGLDSDAFLKLMVAQLRYQDPMAPADGAAMLEQTAQFTQVETMQRIVALQQELMGLQQVDVASSLIGKQVTARGEDGTPITGTVDGLRFTAEGPVLLIGEHAVPLDQATEVGQP